MYKSNLLILCQRNSWELPEFSTTKWGLDHNPSFTATITVNGVSLTAPDDSRTSKEAHNKAAKIALDHFSLPANPYLLQPSRAPPPHSDLCQLYKNQLHNYAQKRNIRPMYSIKREGPPHAIQFKSKVRIDRKTYVSTEFFPTVKEAEHAAAKVALESLSANEVQEDDSWVFKNLLQEFAEKESLDVPQYETYVSGPPHIPTFVSTVEVEGQSFEGQAAKSKKQAQTNVAKVAYTDL